MKPIYHLLLIVFSSFAIKADISISGIVINSDSNPVANATVCLTKRNDLSSKTDSNGNFSILFETSAKKPQSQEHNTPRIVLKNTKLILLSFSNCKYADISIYSVTGKRCFFKALKSLETDKKVVNLPLLSTGHYVLILNLDGKTYQNRFIFSGNDYLLSDNSQKVSKVNIPLAKTLESIDTLIAYKNGYDTTKVPIVNYTQENITLTLDSINSNTNSQKGLTIFFVRHAETVANASGQHGGGGPSENHDSLTELGEKQIQSLKEFLLDENIIPDLIAVSPTIRTQKTIEPFLEEINLKGQIWIELNECCGDEPSGEPLPTQRPESRWKMPVDKISENFIFATDQDQYYWWPGSYEEGLFMVMTARDRILDNFSQSGKTVMIVGHAVNGGILLGLLRGYDMLHNEPSRPVYLMNAAVNKLTQDTLTGELTLKRNIHTPPHE